MSNSTGLSAATTAKLRKDLTVLAHNRVFPVVVETALYGTRLSARRSHVSHAPLLDRSDLHYPHHRVDVPHMVSALPKLLE